MQNAETFRFYTRSYVVIQRIFKNSKTQIKIQIKNSVLNVDPTFGGREYIVATSRFKRLKSLI